MKEQIIYLDDYDWLIKVFYLIEDPYIEGILDELDSIDCEPDTFYRAAAMLERNELNTGFTYTDEEKHVTFIVIGESTSAKEFFNTFVHELGHAAAHIASYTGVKPYSEDLLYLLGEIALLMFDCAKELMCDHCRFYNKVNRR